MINSITSYSHQKQLEKQQTEQAIHLDAASNEKNASCCF